MLLHKNKLSGSDFEWKNLIFKISSSITRRLGMCWIRYWQVQAFRIRPSGLVRNCRKNGKRRNQIYCRYSPFCYTSEPQYSAEVCWQTQRYWMWYRQSVRESKHPVSHWHYPQYDSPKGHKIKKYISFVASMVLTARKIAVTVNSRQYQGISVP